MSYLFEQLPLAFQRGEYATFDNFIATGNQAVVAALRQLLAGDQHYLYLYGASGCGRSHLLQAACEQAEQQGTSSVFLPLAELRDYDPGALVEGLDTLQLVCLDDIERVLGDPAWEQALFSLYNRLQAAGTGLLVSGNAAVRQLPVALPDLQSRLSAGAVFQVQGLGEQQQQALIRQRARERGLELEDEVLQFITARCRRDAGALMQVLEQLDRASLRDQRRLTIPFVKSTLGW